MRTMDADELDGLVYEAERSVSDWLDAVESSAWSDGRRPVFGLDREGCDDPRLRVEKAGAIVEACFGRFECLAELPAPGEGDAPRAA